MSLLGILAWVCTRRDDESAAVRRRRAAGDRARWSDIEVAYERMQREDLDGWTEYLGELTEWELNTATTDNAAAQEWPEYNQ